MNREEQEQEAERIRQKILSLGNSEDEMVTPEEHDFPVSKYLGYSMFDGNFDHCRGSA